MAVYVWVRNARGLGGPADRRLPLREHLYLCQTKEAEEQAEGKKKDRRKTEENQRDADGGYQKSEAGKRGLSWTGWKE